MPDQVTFVDRLEPSLPPGDYQITATQTIALDPAPYPASRTFTVSADRFTLPADRVTAVFPPDNSMGDHHTVLPHIVLNRPTLPWERQSGGPGGWLVLLLFTGAEQPAPATVRLGALSDGAYIPAPALETHQSPDDQVTVIDVPQQVLAGIMPSAADLPYLAHVRRTGGAPDVAVVLGGRLPAAGAQSTAHLVSVEGRYTAAGFDFGPGGPDSLVRLVTLASWRFGCVAADQTFATLVRDLAEGGSPYRLPSSGNAQADAMLGLGQVPVQHQLRQGGTTVSWYRGPFAAGPVEVVPRAATRTSDLLLRFHTDISMFETGYAAAWELGRLLGLQSTDYAIALYEWRRRRSQKQLRTALEPVAGYPLAVPDIDDTLPQTVVTFLGSLADLSGVPLMYLIPDGRLLPVESIRFFQLDRQWIRYLLDGAFSIGRLGAADADADLTQPLPEPATPMTGALLRSDVVAGYPGLLIDAYDGSGAPLQKMSPRRLTPDIMLCLFNGVLTRLDVHQAPESLHFAVELPTPGQVGKTLRDAAGNSGPALPPMPLGPNGRLPISDLAAAMARTLAAAPFGPADFARQMIETAERITFLGH